MQENDTVKGGAPAPKPTKYRLACDNCQQSKIRCDQERPKCRRCAKKSMECVYSPAKRAGRPRTRNNSKGSVHLETSASMRQETYPIAVSERNTTVSAAKWISLSATDDCSTSTSNTSAFPSLAQTFQIPSPEDLDFSLYQQSDEDFLQTLPSFTGSQFGTPKLNIDSFCPTSPDLHVAPELLNLDLCRMWEHQEQEKGHGQNEQNSNTMLLDEGLPYFGLSTPENPQQIHYLEHEEDSIEGRSQPGPSIQEELRPFTLPSEQVSLLSRSCRCITALLDHLPTSPHSPASPSLDSISAALSTSRTLISTCRTAIACPNTCSTRPSVALIICEAIYRALVSLKLSGTSLWNCMQVPSPNYERGTRSPPSPSSSTSSSKSRSHENDIMLPPSLADEEHEPLRCGSLPIRGADRRAVVRVLLVKRVLEMQGVLERLRDTLSSESLVGGDAGVKNPLTALCADVVGEFAVKLAERVETVKLQM